MSFGQNAPEGFIDNKSKNAASYNTQDYLYDIESGYATALFKGDPVVLAGGYLTQATIGGAVCGVFIGVTFKNANGELQFAPYWAANTPLPAGQTAKAYVIDDPYTVFTIQTGSSNAATQPRAVRTSIGRNANFDFGAGGSTSNGKSGAYLDMHTVTNQPDATKTCKILSITPGFSANETSPDENVLDQDYNNVNVIFNNHQFKGGTGTAGT